ncbi:MAG: ATP-grasp domain-containing protein, partial [Bacteroidota bacterium]
AVIKSVADMDKLLMTASVVEPLVEIQKELAVIAARNERGEVTIFPCVEMEFHPVANLVEFLICPANISPYIEAQTEEIATQVIETFDICGLLAVEFFLTKDNEVLINEVAPRPHNSGHHTIDSCYTSQFEQHLRAVTNTPLGSTVMKTPSVMVNLLGAPESKGHAVYHNLHKVMAMPGVNLHLYGKTTTKPYRKMGHATIVAPTTDQARDIARQVKDTLVIANAEGV